ncbi:hypothetical protein L7F22_036615 [Adiantum nelumboides]|nr:hypothetical protein [Adiantum nelumboides]
MQWVVQIISELPIPAHTQSQGTGKRPILSRRVKTRGGHSKRTKVIRDSAVDLSSLPFSESHDTRPIRAVSSSRTSLPLVATATGTTKASFATHIQATAQISTPIGTVGPTPSTVAHHTRLTGATTISIAPSTSTPAPLTSAQQDNYNHFMSRAEKLLSMDPSAVDQITDALHSIQDTHKMHAVTYESIYEEVLSGQQRVFERDVEKAAFANKNRILAGKTQEKDLKGVINSLHLLVHEAQEELKQQSVITTRVCTRCAQSELIVTTSTLAASTIEISMQSIPTYFSAGVSSPSQSFTDSQMHTVIFTSIPLPSDPVFSYFLSGNTVRGLAFMPNMGILSASHDGSVRFWSVNGDPLLEMIGHTAIVYCVAASSSGDVASGSEDCFAKIWKNGTCCQSIQHPGCVWDVKFLPNGDLVTACSDGVVRVWTKDSSRHASLEEMEAYEAHLSAWRTQTKMVSGVKIQDLPGREALLQPGTKNGQTKVIREGDNGVAYTWNAKEYNWDKIGEVVDGPGNFEGKPSLNGQQYDYVFDVNIEDGEPVRKLPYNRGDNPYMVADQWLLSENLPLTYRQQVVEFILQNTGQNAPVINSAYSDPYTGGKHCFLCLKNMHCIMIFIANCFFMFPQSVCTAVALSKYVP